MTAKEYLQQAQKITRRIKLDKGKLAAMRSAMYGKAVSYENDGSQHIGGSNGVENAYMRLLEWEERVNNEINSLTLKVIEIDAVIAFISKDVDREILERRYLWWLLGYKEKPNWDRIAADMGYSKRQITRLHGYALKELEKYVPRCP